MSALMQLRCSPAGTLKTHKWNRGRSTRSEKPFYISWCRPVWDRWTDNHKLTLNRADGNGAWSRCGLWWLAFAVTTHVLAQTPGRLDYAVKNSCPTSASLQISRAASESVQRGIIAACNDIMRDAYEHEGKPEELLRGHLGKLQAIAGDCADDRTALHVSSTLEELKERVKRQRTRGEKISAARFGIPQIDRALNGLEDWGMIVLRGDTKVGKSLLSGSAALSTACELVRTGDPRVVLAYILEAREEWEERAIAWLGHIDKRALEGRKPMREGDEDRYQYALEQWARLPLFVTDRLTHVDEIMLDVEQQVMQGRQPALILVDHFQRVIGDGETATLRYDNAAQKLCQLPRIHKCPLLVPSQISVNNGVRQSMWARRLDQEATVVFDITGERDNPERILHPTLPRKFVPFGEGKYYVGTNYDGRLWDERTWIGMGDNKR